MTGKWVSEEIAYGLKWNFAISNICATKQTPFQVLDLVDSPVLGKVLLLDGLTQSAETDEFVYHECLVQPALLAHKNPRTVFIGGGGEGYTAREVLRHKSVEKVIMVDIDGDVVNFCKENLASVKSAFADPRLEVIISDAKKWIEEYTGTFDVIIMDLDDPIESGPCYWLYTKSFYETLKGKLNEGGIFVTQSSAAGPLHHTRVFTAVNKTLNQVFPKVCPYSQHVFSFCDDWSWNLGFRDADGELPTGEELDKRIAERITGELRFFDSVSFLRIISLPKHVRKSLSEETRILTEENPVFLVSTLRGVSSLTAS